MVEYLLYARIFGIVSIILATGILFNLDHSQKMAEQMIHNATGYIMGGVLPIIFGTWLLMEHNIWVLGWPIVVTIIAWGMLLVGTFRVWFPRFWKAALTKYHTKVPILFALFGLIIGALLLYVGFVSSHLPYLL